MDFLDMFGIYLHKHCLEIQGDSYGGTHFTIEVTIFRCYIATDLRYGQYYFLRFNLDEA